MINYGVIQPGIAIGPDSGLPGTLGALVKCSRSNRLGLISCWHVLVSNAAASAFVARNQCHQRLRIAPGQIIGHTGPTIAPPQSDAAVAWLEPQLEVSHIVEGTDLHFTGVRLPRLGEILTKVGGKTGLTRGRVVAQGDFDVHYPSARHSVHCLYIEPLNAKKDALICAPGDSGAVWFDEQTGEAVGLHVSGESQRFYGPIHAKACLLQPVFETLKLNLYLGP